MIEDVNKSAQTCCFQTEIGIKRDGTGPPFQRKAAAIAATENIRVKEVRLEVAGCTLNPLSDSLFFEILRLITIRPTSEEGNLIELHQ
jgi:hypothetical protein